MHQVEVIKECKALHKILIRFVFHYHRTPEGAAANALPG
jgi:hypothetical protein